MSAETITSALGGRWHGRYGVAMCPAHDNWRTPALSLADGEGGKLLVTCHAGCDAREVLAALRDKGLLQAQRPLASPGARGTWERAKRADAKARACAAKNFALKLWGEAYPICDSIAERYLRERAIRPPFPKALRFHPAIRHPETRLTYPGMIGSVTVGDDDVKVGIHRTFLSRDARKALVSPNKMMLGPCGGGAVRLQDEGDGPLIVCEGVETGLSLRDDLDAGGDTLRLWAALSTSGVKKLILPSKVGELVIAPDGDAPGRAAAEELAQRGKGLGWRVSIMDAPDGRDWNDVARDPMRPPMGPPMGEDLS